MDTVPESAGCHWRLALQCESGQESSYNPRPPPDGAIVAIHAVVAEPKPPVSVFSSAGYVGAKGVSGPLIVPGVSLCLRCFRALRSRAVVSGDELDQLPLFGDLVRRHQPPSFGPLNGIIASITAGQVLLWLAGNRDNVQTLGRRLVFDAISLKSEFLSTEALMDCPRCSAYSLDVRNMDKEIRKNVDET